MPAPFTSVTVFLLDGNVQELDAHSVVISEDGLTLVLQQNLVQGGHGQTVVVATFVLANVVGWATNAVDELTATGDWVPER